MLELGDEHTENNESISSLRDLSTKLVKEFRNHTHSNSTLSSQVGEGKPVSKQITWRNVEETKLKIVLVKRQIAAESFHNEMFNPHLVESHAKYMLGVLNKCIHPNIVQFRDLHLEISLNGADDSSLFLYIVQNGPLSDHQAKKWFSQLVSAVECCHINNCPLRDICLQHLFIDREDNLKLCYFEYPEQFKIRWGQKRQVQKVWGSPVYAAPEAVANSEYYDSFSADIWSLGVVLYVFLNGSLPFIDNFYGYGMSSEEVYVRILSTNHLNFSDSISYLAKDLLSRMMAVNSSMRCRLWNIRYHPWLAEYRQSLLFPLSLQSDLAPPNKVGPNSSMRAIENQIAGSVYPINPVSSLNLHDLRDSPMIGTHDPYIRQYRVPSPAFRDYHDHEVSEEDSLHDTLSPVKPLCIRKKAPNNEINPQSHSNSYFPSPARSVVPIPRISNNFFANGSPRVSQVNSVVGKENLGIHTKKLSIPAYSERRMSRTSSNLQ